MPIFNDDHLDSAQGSAGPRTGFLESAEAAFEQQFRVDSQLALQQEVLDRWNENLNLLNVDPAVNTPSVTIEEMQFYLERKAGNENATLPITSFQSGFSPNTGLTNNNLVQRRQEAFDRIEAQNTSFGKAGLGSFEEIFAEVTALQKEVEERNGRISATGNVTSFLGQLAGGVAGSFTTRDPLLLASSIAPVSAGRNMATRIAGEVALAASVEGVLQYGPVSRNRELAGLPEANKLENVLYAAGGALALSSLFEFGAKGFRSLRERASPDLDLTVEDAQLRQMLEARSQSPDARAGVSLLDDTVEAESLSPYGKSYPAMRRFNAEVAQVELALLGKTDTAVGRTLPDVPFEVTARNADFEIVRAEAPELAVRFDEAAARVNQLDEEIDAISTSMSERNVIDAIRLVDEDAAEELAQLSSRELRKAEQSFETGATFNRFEDILDRVGRGRIMKAVDEAEAAPRRSMQRLRKQRKAANKRLRVLNREMEAERTRINAEAAAVKRIFQGEATDLLGYAIQTRPMQGSKLSAEYAVRQRETLAKDADTLPDRAVGEVLEDGTVDVGTGKPLRADFKVPNDSGEFVNVKDIMDELDEEARLVEAMRSCSL